MRYRVCAAGPWRPRGTGAARAPRLARRHRLHLDVLEDLAVLGYVADVAFLSPDDAVAFDLTKTSGPEAAYVFGRGQFATNPFGLRVHVSDVVTDPIVADSRAFVTVRRP